MGNSTTHTRDECLFSDTHTWVREKHNGIVVVGITNIGYGPTKGQTFTNAAVVGTQLEAASLAGIVISSGESIPVNSPISGTVVCIHHDVTHRQICDDPYGAGWLLELQPTDPSELQFLRTWAQITSSVAQEFTAPKVSDYVEVLPAQISFGEKLIANLFPVLVLALILVVSAIILLVVIAVVKWSFQTVFG